MDAREPSSDRPAPTAPLPGLRLAGRPARRFIAVFALSAAVLLALYYAPSAPGSAPSRWLTGYLDGYASVAGFCLRLADRTVTVQGNDILGRHALTVAKTCDAMDVTILFVCAALAWPGPWRRRLAAAAAGAAALFVVNVVRICSLYYVGIYFPGSFGLVHLELWPMGVLAAGVLLFLVAARWMGRAEPERQAAA